MIDGTRAVTLRTHEMPRAVRFYRALGLRSCMAAKNRIHQLSSRVELTQPHRPACRAALVLVWARHLLRRRC